MLEYKGYKGLAKWDWKAEVYHGSVINTRDVITFQTRDEKELLKEMMTSIDAHLEYNKEIGREPSPPETKVVGYIIVNKYTGEYAQTASWLFYSKGGAKAGFNQWTKRLRGGRLAKIKFDDQDTYVLRELIIKGG